MRGTPGKFGSKRKASTVVRKVPLLAIMCKNLVTHTMCLGFISVFIIGRWSFVCSGLQDITLFSWANHLIQVNAELDPPPHMDLVRPCAQNNIKKTLCHRLIIKN